MLIICYIYVCPACGKLTTVGGGNTSPHPGWAGEMLVRVLFVFFRVAHSAVEAVVFGVVY